MCLARVYADGLVWCMWSRLCLLHTLALSWRATCDVRSRLLQWATPRLFTATVLKSTHCCRGRARRTTFPARAVPFRSAAQRQWWLARSAHRMSPPLTCATPRELGFTWAQPKTGRAASESGTLATCRRPSSFQAQAAARRPRQRPSGKAFALATRRAWDGPCQRRGPGVDYGLDVVRG